MAALQYAINVESQFPQRLEVSIALKRYFALRLYDNITVDDQNDRANIISLGYLSKRFTLSHWLVHLRKHAGATLLCSRSVRDCRGTQWLYILFRPGFVVYLA